MLRSPCSQSTKHDFIHNNQNITVVLNIFCCWPHPEQNRWGILKIWNLDFRSVWKETKHSFTTDKRINFVLFLLIFRSKEKYVFFSMWICFIDGIFPLSLCDICVIFCKSWKTGEVCGKASQTVKYQAVGTIKLRNHKEMGEMETKKSKISKKEIRRK